jgi:hypothetical protein
MPDVVIGAHARARMRQRGVSEAQVLGTLNQPELTLPDPRNHSRKYQRHFGDRVLVVCIVDPAHGKMFVKTVFFLDEEEAK